MNEPKEIEKAVFSKTFIREKIIRTVISALLLVALVFLWNWDNPSQVETVSTNTNDTSTQQTTEPEQTEQTPQEAESEIEEEQEPVFPYEITLPTGASERKQVGTAEKPVYEYTLADGAVMTIYPEGTSAIATDIEWQYQTNEEGNVSVKERKDTLCTAGTAGCTAGNGQIEITAVPSAAADKLVVKIVDNNVATKTVAQAAAQYEKIVNSIRLVR